MTFDDIVDRCVEQFDVTQAKAVAWTNERHARMCAEAQFRMAKKSIGTTVAGQSNYALPAEVVDLARIRIDYSDDPVLYDRVGIEQLWELDTLPGARLTGVGGVFAEDYQADGTVEVRLYPAPDEAGLAITGLQVIQPATLSYGSGSALVVPTDLQPYLLDGVLADGYTQADENLDRAAYHEQRFAEGTERLRRRKNTRLGGPATLQVSRRPWGR